MATILTGPGLASGADFETLTELWTLSFGAPAPIIRNIQTLVADPDRTVVYREDGKAVAGAYLLETTLHIGDDTYSAYYLFAAATHPDFRRKGYMGQIIRYCRTLCEERDIDFLVLVPTDNDLYKYFSRFGFRANFYLKTTQLDREQLLAMVEKMELPEEETSDEPAGFVPTEMHAIRLASLKDGSHVEFDRQTLQYLFFEHVYRGGKTILLEDGYVLYDLTTDDTGDTVLKVRELCAAEEPGRLLQKLSDIEADQYVLNLPAFDSLRGGRTSTGRAGMDLAVSKRAVKAERTMKNAYIGLTMGDIS
ncbi:MAG: GNAT family N-acetyltransferase [Clostridia bacterium]|nr:GNAT family N-acetyltransferase [Clostridia bacterium]MBQ8925662.1 GNAT family N-acetyltransferase [Clostridia bacterium]